MEAEGDDYRLQYKYTFGMDDVDETYGHGLFVQPVRSSEKAVDEAMAWLRGFGPPAKDAVGLGYIVGVGEPVMGDEPPFKFAVWDSIGVRSAQWFFPADIKGAAEMCS